MMNLFQDNYRMYQETKPKKLRKKVKPSAMIRPQKRNKKKKRPVKPPEEVTSKPDNNSTVAEGVFVAVFIIFFN